MGLHLGLGIRMDMGSGLGPLTPPGTSFVTGQVLGTPISNLTTAGHGMTIVIGGANVQMSGIGRWVRAGNALTHTLGVYTGANGAPAVTVATANLNTAGLSVGFNYVPLSLTLLAGQTYHILSSELNGGDGWYDSDSTITTTAVATHFGACFILAGNIGNAPNAPNLYVPVSFKYISP